MAPSERPVDTPGLLSEHPKIASMANNKTVFRSLLSASRRRVTGDRTVSRFDSSPGLFDPITRYFMLSFLPVPLPIVRKYNQAEKSHRPLGLA
jgi:hypothetical protein